MTANILTLFIPYEKLHFLLLYSEPFTWLYYRVILHIYIYIPQLFYKYITEHNTTKKMSWNHTRVQSLKISYLDLNNGILLKFFWRNTGYIKPWTEAQKGQEQQQNRVHVLENKCLCWNLHKYSEGTLISYNLVTVYKMCNFFKSMHTDVTVCK